MEDVLSKLPGESLKDVDVVVLNPYNRHVGGSSTQGERMSDRKKIQFVEITSATYELKYPDAINDVMQHELAHIMSMSRNRNVDAGPSQNYINAIGRDQNSVWPV